MTTLLQAVGLAALFSLFAYPLTLIPSEQHQAALQANRVAQCAGSVEFRKAQKTCAQIEGANDGR